MFVKSFSMAILATTLGCGIVSSPSFAGLGDSKDPKRSQRASVAGKAEASPARRNRSEDTPPVGGSPSKRVCTATRDLRSSRDISPQSPQSSRLSLSRELSRSRELLSVEDKASSSTSPAEGGALVDQVAADFQAAVRAFRAGEWEGVHELSSRLLSGGGLDDRQVAKCHLMQGQIYYRWVPAQDHAEALRHLGILVDDKGLYEKLDGDERHFLRFMVNQIEDDLESSASESYSSDDEQDSEG